MFRHCRSRVTAFKETTEQRDCTLWELSSLETAVKLPGNEGQGMSAREMPSVTEKHPYRTGEKKKKDFLISIHHHCYSPVIHLPMMMVDCVYCAHHSW